MGRSITLSRSPMQLVASHIKRIRESKNLTQEYVASRLGISQNAYSRLENNRTHLSIDRLKKIAQILSVPLDELFLHKDPLLKDPYHPEPHEFKMEHYNEMISLLKKEIEYLRKENLRLVELLDKRLSRRN